MALGKQFRQNQLKNYVNILGMTMGPAFQLLFTPIGYPGFQYPGSKILRISMYTAPAILACAMNLLNAICIHKLFREIYAGVISVRLVSFLFCLD